MSLHFAEELESIKIGFGPELDSQLKELVTELVGVNQGPQGLPPYIGIFNNKFVLPLTLSGNDVAVFLSLNMRNLGDNVRIVSNKDWSVSLI